MSFEPGTNSENKYAQIRATGRESSRERKFQGAKVPHLELSLPGANGLGSEKSSYRFLFLGLGLGSVIGLGLGFGNLKYIS